MPKTLLAVDDSATMRKVLEITFSGEDFSIVTADGQNTALNKQGEATPAVCLIDTSLGSDDGYALAKEIRKRDPKATIVLMASRYNPYDAGKGKDAGVDDYIDKPFDTQSIIDKVRKAVLTKEGGAAAQPAAAAAAKPAAATPAAAAAAPAAGGKAQPTSQQRQRAATLVFGSEGASLGAMGSGGGAGGGGGGGEASPAAPAAKPAAATAAAAPAAAAAATVAASTNGHLAGKLSELGLSPAQADAVLALSREVVERVVWEVVPQLAEALIKEEIARLTK